MVGNKIVISFSISPLNFLLEENLSTSVLKVTAVLFLSILRYA